MDMLSSIIWKAYLQLNKASFLNQGKGRKKHVEFILNTQSSWYGDQPYILHLLFSYFAFT